MNFNKKKGGGNFFKYDLSLQKLSLKQTNFRRDFES